ncbi:sodium/glucose cotransporter 4-like [Ptychodera flava]|uniref:sodium/glucose cotransporter 4-like n=1 Tax=Ptychodera flava TaxID=63121 RepID=UPI00396A048A
MTDGSLATVDYLVVILTLLGIFVLGLWSSRSANRGSSQGYFLAGRSMSWWVVGLSLYVSNIGSGTFIGISGAAAVDGIAVVVYEFTGTTCLALLGFIFVPVYIASGAYTMPDYLEKRFGGQRIRVYVAVVQLLLMLFCYIAGEMYAGSLIIQVTLGWNVYASVIALLILTAIYTVAGGLTAVMHTDALMAIIILIGAFILMVISYVEMGSYYLFESLYMDAVPSTTLAGNLSCGIPEAEAWHLFRPVDSSMPWPGVFFGIHILSGYYFCANQVLVQRTLAAKNLTHAQAGTILAGYLKILPMFLMVYPGMISRILHTETVACVDPDVCFEACGSYNGCSDVAYPYLILTLMPIVLKGLMLAAMLAGVMSSFTSIFNSASSLFTVDIWKMARPKCSANEEMVVGRVFTVILVCLSVLWLPLIEAFGAGQLFIYLQSIASYLSPPMLAAFILAICWERINEPGSFWGLMVGLVFGLVRMIRDFVYAPPKCDEEDTRPYLIRTVHYLHFAILLFCVTFVAIILVSLVTKAQSKDKLIGLTWWTRHNAAERIGREAREKELKEKLEQQYFDNIELQHTDGSVQGVACSAADKTDQSDDEISTKESDVNIAEVSEDAESSVTDCLNRWLCGINKDAKDQEIQNQKEAEAAFEVMTMNEDPKWSRIAKINCLVMLCVSGFFWGFYA